jgi:hypothetical protein
MAISIRKTSHGLATGRRILAVLLVAVVALGGSGPGASAGGKLNGRQINKEFKNHTFKFTADFKTRISFKPKGKFSAVTNGDAGKERINGKWSVSKPGVLKLRSDDGSSQVTVRRKGTEKFKVFLSGTNQSVIFTRID